MAGHTQSIGLIVLSSLRDSSYVYQKGQRREPPRTTSYCSLAYSALACFRMGISGSASFRNRRQYRVGVSLAHHCDEEPLSRTKTTSESMWNCKMPKALPSGDQ